MNKIEKMAQCEGCRYLGRYGSGERRWTTCACTVSCGRLGGNEGDRFEAMPTVAPNLTGNDKAEIAGGETMSTSDKCVKCNEPLSVFEAGVCGKCKDPIRQMHEQIERLCERMSVAEQIMATGYIYPKTLPDDAVIVIRTDRELSEALFSGIEDYFQAVWPDTRIAVLCDGMSLEIIEGGKDNEQT